MQTTLEPGLSQAVLHYHRGEVPGLAATTATVSGFVAGGLVERLEAFGCLQSEFVHVGTLSCGEPLNLVNGFYCSHPEFSERRMVRPGTLWFSIPHECWAVYWNGWPRQGRFV